MNEKGVVLIASLLVMVLLLPLGLLFMKMAMIEAQITQNYVAMWEEGNKRDAMFAYAMKYWQTQQSKKGATNVCKVMGPTWEGAYAEYHCKTGLNLVTIHAVYNGIAIAQDYRFNPPSKRGPIPGTWRMEGH